MLRPENDKLFSNSNFKFVVLDEAHIYSGATGMETALLLRRLKARIGGNGHPQFILTSATLGKQGESEGAIVNFAQNLCGEPFDSDCIVFGQRETPKYSEEENALPIAFFEEIAAAEPEQYDVVFDKYGIKRAPLTDAYEVLYDCCMGSRYYRALRREQLPPTDIGVFATILGVDKQQAVAFVHVCSIASKNGKSLLDARYHFFVKALEGVYLTLDSTKQLFLERKEKTYVGSTEIAVFEGAVCSNCGEMAVVGMPQIEGKLHKLSLCSKASEKVQFFHVDRVERDTFEEIDEEDIDLSGDIDVEVESPKEKNYKQYYLCSLCGAISEKDDGYPHCGHESFLIVSEYTNSGGKCLKCQMGKYRRFYIGAEAATGVLATTLYEELPTKVISEVSPDGVTCEYTGGKQFLTFSDSRSDAAYFASYLDKSYKEFLRRRGIMQTIEKNREDLIDEVVTFDEFVGMVAKLFKKKESFKSDLTQNLSATESKHLSFRHAWMAMLTELVYAQRRNSLVSLGQIAFEYMGNTDKIVTVIADKYGMDKKTCKALLDYLVMSFARFGAISVDDDDILEPEDKKYVFYTEKQKFVCKQKTAATSRYYMGFLARNREGKENDYFKNSRALLVARVLHSDIKTANALLSDYFDNWLINKPMNRYHLEKGNGDFYCLPSQHFRVRVQGDPEVRWYRCEKCGKVSPHNIDGICVELGCGGTLRVVDTSAEMDRNHYLRLYRKPELTALLIREHTAQLSREEGLQYQTDFEKNHIHALSCSTTFEMGVDVGELETVFLRNVPPTSANYAQRAGRAGRGKESAAYSLTYAKLSSHDFTFFNEPQKIIVGQIKPPLFKINNEKIVLRHINAVVLSYFFKKYPEYFDNNHTAAFLENGGYEELARLVSNPPKALLDILNQSIPDVASIEWQKKLIDEDDGLLYAAVKEYQDTVQEIGAIIESSAADKDYEKAKNYQRMLERFCAKQMIDFLVRNNILPKYGFPIDTVELDVSRDKGQRHELQLQRDLKMAISEYAPGEKVIANNKMFTSRYIKRSFFHNKMDFHRSYVCRCSNPECASWNYSLVNPKDKEELINCVSCHNPIAKGNWHVAIEPRGGFAAESRVEEVPLTRPEKIYHSQDSYIGNGKSIDEKRFLINGKIVLLRSSENDSIMVTSNTDFYVCEWCGFAYGEHDVVKDNKGNKDTVAIKDIKKKAPYMTAKGDHHNLYGQLCPNHVFTALKLNHVYKTDVVVLDFGEHFNSASTMYSAMYAILYAMSDILDIDSADISGCLNAVDYDGHLSFSIVLFDTVAGGAGNVRRLIDTRVFASVIRAACDRMNGCTCDTSCYNCLRSYSNQRLHEQLDRHKAYMFLSDYLGSVSEE